MAARTINERLRLIVETLGLPEAVVPQRVIAEELAKRPYETVWLVLSVLRSELPTSSEVRRTARDVSLRGAAPVLARAVRHAQVRRALGRLTPVTVMADQVVVDATHTARTALATGIQRVVRMTLREWEAHHELAVVGWNSSYTRLHLLSADERRNAAYGDVPHPKSVRAHESVVPWNGTFVLPELAIEESRVARIAALAEFTNARCGAIGYDTVPVTSHETVARGMGSAFAGNLDALAVFDRVCTISEAAGQEYAGWKAMLPASGRTGPEIFAELLPGESAVVSDAAIADTRATLGLGEEPVVLCVGSHEPRKNHAALLHAAELLWQKGHVFHLLLVGGNAWGATETLRAIEDAQARGRAITVASKISDTILGSAYRIARFSVFPSLNEGFGLPVAESLAAGTPVITSGFGSMAEIAAQGGCVLIDPRNDRSIADAMESLLVNDALLDDLIAQIRLRSTRSWADYAHSVWRHLVHG